MSFLRDYLTHATNNEAPYMFHVWCGYYVLSATISRRVWMRLDDYAIYPNIYVMLVGGAGNAKTASLQKAKRMVQELDLPFSGSVETPQGMWRFMTGDSNMDKSKPIPPYGGANHKIYIDAPHGVKVECHPMNIIASEFINFIGQDDKGWINALNDIYDEDVYHYRTKNMGTDLVTAPYITLLGGLTSQTATSMQKEQIINTGLARRTFFQHGERDINNPHPRPRTTQVEIEARERAMAHLRNVLKVKGEFLWTPETEAWWDAWYVPHLKAIPTRPSSVQGWYYSKSTQLMKLAMLTSLSERLDKVLEVRHFQTALDFMAEMEKQHYKIFGGIGANDLNDLVVKIYNHLSLLHEPVEFNKIKTVFFRDIPPGYDRDKAIGEVLKFLREDGKIEAHNLGLAVNGHHPFTPTTIFAIPEVFREWTAARQSDGVLLVQSRVTPTGLPVAAQASTDPSSEPSPVPAEDSDSANLTSVQSPNGIVASAIPMLVKRP